MSVELISQMGDDLTIVNAARVSYGKESKELTSADRQLIGFLARERHGSPFEHVVFTFRVRTPIFVAREWFRHRIGSFNEISGRYVELPPGVFVPQSIRRQVGKPGSYHYELAPDIEDGSLAVMRGAFEASLSAYRALIEMGVAREQARIVLPLAQYTEFIWTVNYRSLSNFLSLRTALNAMQEIREEATDIELLVEKALPVAHAAWDANGRRPL